jgi:V/A-type H+-transporting ATPase subunit D
VKRLPPGRTARLWLRNRLGVAHRALDVLEQKSHALSSEQRRLRAREEEAETRWEEALAEADRWFLRAMVLGGRTQLDLARLQAPAAEAFVAWRSLMGVTYPADVELRGAEAPTVGRTARSAALPQAARAYRQALERALELAAAARARRLVEEELELTRRRVRGLENRWLPRLEEALHAVELRLSEEEREEMVRVQWFSRRSEAGA